MGSLGEGSSIQCLNVRGLALLSNRVKVQTIEDSLLYENSIGIFLCETWLDNTISDAEIQMKDYEIFRADREGRIRGGSAIYLRKELQCKKDFHFSNSVVEIVMVKCRKLKSV